MRLSSNATRSLMSAATIMFSNESDLTAAATDLETPQKERSTRESSTSV